MDGVAALASQITSDPGLRFRQALVMSVDSGSTLTVRVGGDTTSVSGVRYFSSAAPRVGSSVWLVSDGRDVIALGAIEGGWTTFAPVVTPATGALTAYTATGRWRRLGSAVTCTVNVVITTVGTAAGAGSFTLPVAASSSALACVGAGRDATSGNSLVCTVAAGASTATFLTYNNATPFVANWNMVLTVTYEAA